MAKTKHEQWGSSFGFILAAVGSAVGLGNIWKFPYMVGESGGSAFVITYLLCIALIGFPILVAEWLIGRRGQENPINSMKKVATSENQSSLWSIIGIMGVLGSFLILSFYSVIGGWALNYSQSVVTGTFSGLDSDAVGSIFEAMLANPLELGIWHTLFTILTVVIVIFGVAKGIEKASKLLMPLLGLFLLVIVGYNFINGGLSEAFAYLFTPDFSKIDSSILLNALGHAFFTLSLGMGIMMSYGSYLGRDIDILKTARMVVILDTVIALVAGLAIFPIIFSNGLDPAEGPGLIFVSLPIAFGNMSGGLILGLLFFSLLTFAALTSAISLLEPSVEFLEERTSMSRLSATILAGIGIWIIGIAALLSFNLWSDFAIFGNNIFDALDKLTSKLMLPLTGLGVIIFFGWFMEQDKIQTELGMSDGGFKIFQVLSRFVAPIGVVIVFLSSLIG